MQNKLTPRHLSGSNWVTTVVKQIWAWFTTCSDSDINKGFRCQLCGCTSKCEPNQALQLCITFKAPSLVACSSLTTRSSTQFSIAFRWTERARQRVVIMGKRYPMVARVNRRVVTANDSQKRKKKLTCFSRISASRESASSLVATSGSSSISRREEDIWCKFWKRVQHEVVSSFVKSVAKICKNKLIGHL